MKARKGYGENEKGEGTRGRRERTYREGREEMGRTRRLERDMERTKDGGRREGGRGPARGRFKRGIKSSRRCLRLLRPKKRDFLMGGTRALFSFFFPSLLSAGSFLPASNFLHEVSSHRTSLASSSSSFSRSTSSLFPPPPPFSSS